MTASWICWPAGRCQFKTWLPSIGVMPLAGDAKGSAAATNPQVEISMSRTLRIIAPRLNAWSLNP